MNWTDLAVLIVIALFVLICWKRGFLLSLVGLASAFIAFFVTWKFYPLVTDMLMKTRLNSGIATAVANNLSSNPAISNAINSQVQSTVSEALRTIIFLPEFVKNKIVASLANTTSVLPMRQIIDYISSGIAKLALTGLAILLLFAGVWLALWIAKLLIRSLNQLPVLKQADKTLGILMGLVQGLLFVYIAMAAVVLLASLPQFKNVADAIDKSLIASWFYKHNILLGLLK